MNGLSVSGQKADQNLQIEVEFKPEVKNYKLYFFIPVRSTRSNISLKFLNLDVLDLHSMC